MLMAARNNSLRQLPLRSWPLKLFKTDRHFNREEENLSYIKWISGDFNTGVEATGEDDDEDDNDDNEDEPEKNDEDGNSSVCKIQFEFSFQNL
jgi:hypothetical protein